MMIDLIRQVCRCLTRISYGKVAGSEFCPGPYGVRCNRVSNTGEIAVSVLFWWLASGPVVHCAISLPVASVAGVGSNRGIPPDPLSLQKSY